MSLDLSDATSYYSLGNYNSVIGFYKFTGGTITLGAAPTGWAYAYSVNGSPISGNTFDISADASVTVTRTPIDYTITYNLGGGTNASGNPSTYTIQSQTITLAAPTREGYTFGGWYANSSLTGDAVTTIASGQTGDVTLWAKWTPKQYTITYNLSGGTNAEDNPTAYTIESDAITLGAATKTGYTFGGWYRSADLSGDAVTTIQSGSTGDVELWAKWTANRYAIAFVGNGKTSGTMYNELFNYDEAKARQKYCFAPDVIYMNRMAVVGMTIQGKCVFFIFYDFVYLGNFTNPATGLFIFPARHPCHRRQELAS